ncbi:MAG: DUF3105 domain-containing protein [Nitriliruptoraceae bacterium]
MAEKERLTNKQRREQARQERKRKELEVAQKRKRNQVRNGLVTFGIVGVVAAVLLQALLGGTATIDDTIEITAADASDARSDAGCEVLTFRQPLPARYHFEANQAPNPATIYPDIRPTHSGPHSVGMHPITAAATSQISEVASTHNLEHGSIIVWWDPESVPRSTANDIGSWAETLNASGFRRDVGGVGIMTAPYEDPGMSSGKSIALRAWGTAMDCDTWDETVANAFVLDNYGMHGIGPERNLAPFPDGVLAYSDLDVSDTPAEEAPSGTPSDDEMVELDDDELEQLG